MFMFICITHMTNADALTIVVWPFKILQNTISLAGWKALLLTKWANFKIVDHSTKIWLCSFTSSLVTDYMILNLNSLSTPRGKCCFLLGIRQRVNKTIHKVLINAKHTVSIQETVFILHRNNCVLPNIPYDKIQGEKNIYNIYGSHRLLSLTYNMLTAW